ncbi:LysR family transcriptional regulator [Vibrio astriarenae]|uniref:LysR family transcriptional regulator n=1 Tax=Vibrio astriarenae TaxID=1481923 RepID=A0A7Z2T6N9_9VIBR|nr:LysR family transcriptional regulator [Vibrio astriarenae]QIA65331.1 LysR family transcriptional regulator [Vibrio astriarenae]
MISIEQVQAFTLVYEEGSYSSAAKIAQKERSTIREHVLAMEDTLGVKLFEIEGRRAVPTTDAESLIVRSRNLSKHARDFYHAAMTLYKQPLSKMIVWHDSLIPNQLLGEVITRLREEYPELEIECCNASREEAFKAVEQDQCHIAVMSTEHSTVSPGKFKSTNIGSLTMNPYGSPISDLGKSSVVSMSDLQLSTQYIMQHSKARDLGYFEIGNRQHKVSSVELAIALMETEGWTVLSDMDAAHWVESGKLKLLNLDHLIRGYKHSVSTYYSLSSDSIPEVNKALSIFKNASYKYLI